MAQIFTPPATIAKALTIRLHMKMDVSHNLYDVLVESDCLPVIEACRGTRVRLDLYNVIKNILNLKTQIGGCGFTWTCTNGYSVAHELTSSASRCSLQIGSEILHLFGMSSLRIRN